MSRINCINCGLPKEINESKCPFCGTLYLDLTNSQEPIVCQFFLPYNNQEKILICMKAIPLLENINLTIDQTTEYGDKNVLINNHIEKREANVEVCFKSIGELNSNNLLVIKE